MDAYQLPNWVFKRNGSLVAFEADKISQSLFAATEELGRPNAFLARELADGVLHFLVQETGGENPTTMQIAEVVAKVTRELGHPDLAKVYEAAQSRSKPVAASPVAAASEKSVSRPLASPYSEILTRDLASAMRDGLLQLPSPHRPRTVDRLVLEARSSRFGWGDTLLEEMVRLREEVGSAYILDSPDQLLAPHDASTWTRHLCLLLEALDRQAIVHLNMSSLPLWAKEGGAGPLFNTAYPEKTETRDDSIAKAILDELSAAPTGHARVRVDWHVREETSSPPDPALVHVIQRLPQVRCVLDRAAHEPSLGEGVDRQHPCVLLEVGLDLSRFFHLDGIDGNVDHFLEKLPSLTHMAISAGVQKRAYLSRAASSGGLRRLAQGFLLFRARLLITPIGLDKVVSETLGMVSNSRAATDLELRVLKTVEQSAMHHGRARNLEAVLEPTGLSKPASVLSRWQELEEWAASFRVPAKGSGSKRKGMPERG